MQVRKILPLIGTLFLLCCSFFTEAQVLTTNEDGEKIVVYSDGSWAYFDGLDSEEQKAISETSAKQAKKNKKKAKKEKKRTKKEKKNKSRKKKDKADKRTGKSKDRSKKQKVKYSDRQEQLARQEAIQRADWAAMEELRTKNLKMQAGQELSLIRQQLSSAYSNTDISVKELDELDKKYKNQQVVLNNAAATHAESEAFLEKMEGMIDMKKSKRDKMLAAINQTQEAEVNDWTSDLTDSGQSVKKKGKKDKRKDRKKGNAVLVTNQNLIQYPPTPPCELAYDGIDEFTGKRRWEMHKRVFFTHTSDRLKPFFKEKNHITVEGYISGASGNGGTYYLNLNLIILSEMAQREFGVLEKGSILTLKLINGNNVKLFNTKTSTGTLDKVEKRVEYRAQYMINSDNLKSLRKSEVDKARIVWGKGYEDYEVYNLDFFIDQLECLEKNK